MTQANDVNIPEGDVLDDAAPAPAKKAFLSPGMKFGVLIIGAMVMISAGIFYTAANQSTQTSQVPPASTLDSTPGGEVQQNSAVYQDSVSRMNDNRSEKAAELGITSVPTPEAIMSQVEEIKDIETVEVNPEPVEAIEEPKPAPKPVERRVLPRPPAPPAPEQVAAAQPSAAETSGRAGEGQQQEKNPYREKMVGQMGVMALEFRPKQMQELTISAGEDEETAGVATDDSVADGNSGGTTPEAMVLRPGDILYGETLTSVNSDVESPVLVEITTGKFKGARLVGKFTANRQAAKMLVEFDNMTDVDGMVYEINAVAVDGKTAETAVASDVKRRYVARYAPLLAATFITGYAQSAAQPGSTVTGSGDGQQISVDASTTEQSVLAGVAAATGAIAEDILQSAPKGPKIILTDGYPVAIMVVDPVLESGMPSSTTDEQQPIPAN